MNILAIDTCETFCSIALLKGHDLIAAKQENIGRGHAEKLLPMIEAMLCEHGIPAQALEQIAVTTGPGTFTGLRIGLSVARGMALVLKIPCIGINLLECLAMQAVNWREGYEVIHCCIKGRGETSYYQAFRCDESAPEISAIDQAASLPHDQIIHQIKQLKAEKAICIGSGALVIADHMNNVGDAIKFIENPCDPFMLGRLSMGKNPEEYKPEPVYLREADAKKSKPVFPFAPKAS